jgi:hypothetical protein
MKQRLYQGLGLFAFLALVACSGGPSSVPSTSGAGASNTPSSSGELTRLSTFMARDDETGTIVQILPTANDPQLRSLMARNASSTNNLLYYGGLVQTAPQLYVERRSPRRRQSIEGVLRRHRP